MNPPGNDTPTRPGSRRIEIRRLGTQDYLTVWQQMRDFTEQRDDATADEIWLVEHPPIFTLGQAGRLDHVRDIGAIPLVRTDRGGQVTYHGPGQLVAYILLDLRRHRCGVKELVARLEQAIIDLLGGLHINAERQTGAPGIYVHGAKIAALGLRVRHGCTYHGLSLNVAMDLEPFTRIDPCGYRGLQTTDLAALLGRAGHAAPGLGDIESALLKHLLNQLQ